MLKTLRAAAWVAAAVWVGLAVARGRFWDASADGLRPAEPDGPAPDVHAVVPARNEADVDRADPRRRCSRKTIRAASRSRWSTTAAKTAPAPSRARAVAQPVSAQRRARRRGAAAARGLDRQGVGARRGRRRRARERRREPAYWWFSDADVEHDPDTLARLVATARRDDRALVSQMVALHCAFAARSAC